MTYTKNIFLVSILLLSIAVLFPSCEEPSSEEGKLSEVQVTFKAVNNGNPFVMNQRFTHAGKELSISKLKFYISDLVLLKDSKEATIDEIDVIDFTTTNIDEAGANKGITLSNQQVPTGNYNALKFGIGVSSDLNNQKPADFAPGHPLRNDADYWSAWSGYIFSKIEGRFNNDNNPDDLESSFVYHIGKNDFFRETSFSNLNINVKENNIKEIVIHLDITKLLAQGNGNPLDVSTTGDIHSSQGQEDYVSLFANNWKKAFEIQ